MVSLWKILKTSKKKLAHTIHKETQLRVYKKNLENSFSIQVFLQMIFLNTEILNWEKNAHPSSMEKKTYGEVEKPGNRVIG